MKWIFSILVMILAIVPTLASAHSTVTPSQTLPTKYETFTLSVPTEKEMPTIGVRLLIPESLERVTPFVKPGWNIEVVKNASGTTTELIFRGGSIPANQKDIFQFTARTPATSTTLIWKAYQTYADGTIVAWDQDPASGTDGAHVGNPYSVSQVAPVAPTAKPQTSAALPLSLASLALSALALGAAFMRKKV